MSPAAEVPAGGDVNFEQFRGSIMDSNPSPYNAPDSDQLIEASADPEKLTAVDRLISIVFPSIGLILGFVRVCTDKPTGPSMMGMSVLFGALWFGISFPSGRWSGFESNSGSIEKPGQNPNRDEARGIRIA
ncbi:MAG: hypothetical protein R3C49_12000 [Planctomycetaceae bacterium]